MGIARNWLHLRCFEDYSGLVLRENNEEGRRILEMTVKLGDRVSGFFFWLGSEMCSHSVVIVTVAGFELGFSCPIRLIRCGFIRYRTLFARQPFVAQ